MRLLTASALFFFLACSVCFGQQDDLSVSATVANPASGPQDQPTPTKQVTVRDQGVSPIRSQDEAIRQELVTINIIGGYVVVNCNEEFADGLRGFLTDLNYHISRK